MICLFSNWKLINYISKFSTSQPSFDIFVQAWMLNDKMWYVNVKILRTVIAQILRIYGIKLFFCSRKLRFCQVFVIKRSRGQNTDHYTIELFSLDIDTMMKVCLPNQRINRFLKCESAFKRHFQKGEGTFSEYCEFITVPMLKLKNSNNDRTQEQH